MAADEPVRSSRDERWALDVSVLDFVLAALLVAAAVACAAASGTRRGLLAAAAMLAFAAYLVAVGMAVRRNRAEVASAALARRRRTQDSMRRYPWRWLVGLPVFGAVDGAVRVSTMRHHSPFATGVAAAGGAAIALVVAAIATWHARRGVGATR